MQSCPETDFLLVVPHLRVQGANAVGGVLTYGFPAMTAFLGFMWALERRAAAQGIDAQISAIAPVVHQRQLLTEGPRLTLKRAPLNKEGGTAGIIEEGRMHMEVSLVMAVSSQTWLHEPGRRAADLLALDALARQMRVAGGVVVPQDPLGRDQEAYLVDMTSGDEDHRAMAFARLRRQLLPGFALVLRERELSRRLAHLRESDPKATMVDALLAPERVLWQFHADTEPGYVPTQEGPGIRLRPPSESRPGPAGRWVRLERPSRGRGYLVPAAVGYAGLHEPLPPGAVDTVRDKAVSYGLVEAVYSLCEWISPHRLREPRDLLWYARTEPVAGLYLCRNDWEAAQPGAAALSLGGEPQTADEDGVLPDESGFVPVDDGDEAGDAGEGPLVLTL